MKLPKGHLRALLSLVLAMTVTTLFTLRSYAAIDTKSETLAQDCTGTLTVKSGTVTVNGNASQTVDQSRARHDSHHPVHATLLCRD